MLRCYDFGQFPDKFFVIFDFTQSAAGNGNTVLFTGQDSSLAYEDFQNPINLYFFIIIHFGIC